MKAKITIVAAVMLGWASASIAQCKEWKWPADKATAEEKYVLHNDLVTNGQYEKAIAPHQWLLENASDLNTAIYINGEKIYTNLADDAQKANDMDKMAIYADSLMMIYDMRMENCGEADKVMERKSLYAFKYFYKDKSRTEWLLELFDKNFELNGKDMMSSNFRYYMTTVQLNKLYHDNLSDDQIIEKYDAITEALNKKIAETQSSKYKKMAVVVDQIFFDLIEFDCETVRTKLGPKFDANPKDLDLARKIFKFMAEDGCTDDPLWLKAGQTIFEDEPDFGLALNLGRTALAAEDTEKAEFYFQKAVEFALNDEDKSKALIQLGHIDREKGAKSAARVHYREAAEAGDKDGYNYIGYLYMTSYDQCAGRQSKVKDRLVYIAAYNYFVKGGNSSQAALAKQQFPSVGEIFEENVAQGSTMQVGCWINESVTVSTRD